MSIIFPGLTFLVIYHKESGINLYVLFSSTQIISPFKEESVLCKEVGSKYDTVGTFALGTNFIYLGTDSCNLQTHEESLLSVHAVLPLPNCVSEE